DAARAPCTLVRLRFDQAGRTHKGGLHALYDSIAAKLGANRLANDRARAVATDEIAAAQAPAGAGVELAQDGARGAVLHHLLVYRGSVGDLDTRLGGGMVEQDRLKEYLVDPMRRLRR